MGIKSFSVFSFLALICQTASFADELPAEQPVLQSQQATLDSSKKETRVLNGAVERHDRQEQGSTGSAKQDDQPGKDGNAMDGRAADEDPAGTIDPQEAEKLIKSASGLFKLLLGQNGIKLNNQTIQLSRRTPKLSPEEYRKMEYGIIGLDSFLQVGGPGPVVTKVYPGSPAAKAGIQRGDLIVKARNHVFKPGEAQRVLWQVIAGRAGTPVDMTVLRNGELVTVEMLHMNIEDVEDKNRRRQYECLLDSLGAPHYTDEGDLIESAKKDANDLRNAARFGTQRLQLELDSLRNKRNALPNE